MMPICRPSNAHLFDPDAGTEANAEAMRMCAECPLRDACADKAQEVKAWGIWGGRPFVEGQAAHLAPRIVTYTSEQQKDAHRRYQIGERDKWVIDANRAYHQAWKERKLARMSQVDALLVERFGSLEEAS